MNNYAVIYKDDFANFPSIWSSASKDKEGALNAFRINKGNNLTVISIIKLPKTAPKKFNKKK